MRFASLLLAGLALGATSPAWAQIPNPQDPGGAGGLVFAAWDSDRSYTFYTGFTIDSFDPMTPGQVFTLPGIADAFGPGTISADNTSFLWSVVAADALGDQLVGGQRLLITGVINNFTNDGIRSGAGNVGNFIRDVNVFCTAPDGFPACAATNADLHYAGRDSYAEDFGFTGALNVASNFGEEASFLLAESTGLFGDPVFTDQPFTWVFQEDGAGGFQLIYGAGDGPPPPIPVPAAFWLMLSGVCGLAGAARRGRGAAAV